MKACFLIIVLTAVSLVAHSQKAGNLKTYDEQKPFGDEVVSSHKDVVHLTLIIDSVVRAGTTYQLNRKIELDIKSESGYIQIANDLFLKVFISRNEEYEQKFYSWRWNFIKKEGVQYRQLGRTDYQPLSFNSDVQMHGASWGSGIGDEDTADYLMFYYRYKLY